MVRFGGPTQKMVEEVKAMGWFGRLTHAERTTQIRTGCSGRLTIMMKVRALRTGVCYSKKLAGQSATQARPVGTDPGRLRVNLGIQEGAVMIGR